MADSLRERKKEQTRLALKEAAVRLFVEKGYTATSIEDIASAADVSRRTFFRYFGSKEGVIFAEADQTGAALVAGLLGEPSENSPLVAYRDVIVRFVEAFPGRQEDILAQQRVIRGSLDLRSKAAELSRQWRGRIAEGFAQRDGRVEANDADRVLAGAALGVMQSAMEDWVAAEGKDDLRDRITKSFDVLLKAGS